MNTVVKELVLVIFIATGVLLAVFPKTIVSWLYEKTMNFWAKTVSPERKQYLDDKYQKVWYWKMWWLWSVWTYRIIGLSVAAIFTILLILTLIK